MIHQKEEMKAVVAQHQAESDKQQALVEAKASETKDAARELIFKHQVDT